MAMEAQHLIDISLAKITQARFSRGGVSLHKNLLVATVLQKAKFMFMEEISHMVHHYYPRRKKGENCDNDDDIDIMTGDDRENENGDAMPRGKPSLFEIYTRTGRASPLNGASGSIIVNPKHKSNDMDDDDDDDDDYDSDSNDYVFLDETDDVNDIKETESNQTNNIKWRRSSLKRRKEVDTSSSSSDEDDVIVKRNKSDSTIYSHHTSVITEHKSVNNNKNFCQTTCSSNDVKNNNAQFSNGLTNGTSLSLYVESDKQQSNPLHYEQQSSSSSDDDDIEDDENQGQPDTLTATLSGTSPLHSVDIERFTSLVSLFNITPQIPISSPTTSSSASSSQSTTSTSNELCSSQATISAERENTISTRPFLAMTV